MAKDKKDAELAVSEKKEKKGKDKESSKKQQGKIAKWFKDLKMELKKVVWPTPKQTLKGSAVAIVMMVVCAIVLWGFDSAAQAVVKALINIFA